MRGSYVSRVAVALAMVLLLGTTTGSVASAAVIWTAQDWINAAAGGIPAWSVAGNWDASGGGSAPPGPADVVDFSDGPLATISEVDVDADTAIDILNFTGITSGGYDLSGAGILTLAELNQSSGDNTISNPISGMVSGSVTGGSLKIANPNSTAYGHDWTIDGGDLTVNGSESTGPAITGTEYVFGANGGTLTLLEAVVLGPGLDAGEITGNSFDEASPNPATQIDLGPVMAQVNTTGNNPGEWKNDSTWVYTGQIYDADGILSFVHNFDDSVLLKIDGTTYLRDTAWNNVTSTGTLDIGPGWHDIEMRFGQGAGGAGPNQNPWDQAPLMGFGLDPDGSGSTNKADYIVPLDDGSGTLFRRALPTGTVYFNSSVAVESGSGTVNVDNGVAKMTTLSIAEGLSLTKTGSGQLSFAQVDSTYVGNNTTIQIDAGTLALGADETVNPLGGSAVDLNGGILRLEVAPIYTPGGADGLKAQYWDYDPTTLPNNDDGINGGPSILDSVYGLRDVIDDILPVPNVSNVLTDPFDFPALNGADAPDSNTFASIGVDVGANNIVAAWTGALHVDPADEGAYDFWTQSDDGSAICIWDGAEWVMLNNNDFQGIGGSETAMSLTLAAGDYPVAMYFYEGAGGNGLYFEWDPNGAGRQVIDPDAVVGTGTKFVTGDFAVVESMDYGNDINVLADSTVNLAGPVASTFGALTHADGTALRLTGNADASATFTGTTLTGTLTLNTEILTHTGPINDGGSPGRLIKTGPVNLPISPGSTLSSGTVIEIAEAAVVGLHDGTATGPFGDASIEVHTGTQLVLSTAEGVTTDQTYTGLLDQITIAGNGATISAGIGDFGDATPKTITADGTLALPEFSTTILQATDGYTLVAANTSGDGILKTTEGVITLDAAGTFGMNMITATGGTLNIDGPVTTSSSPLAPALMAELHVGGGAGDIDFSGDVGTGGRLGDTPVETQLYAADVDDNTFVGLFSNPPDWWQGVWTGKFVPAEDGDHIFRVGQAGNPTGGIDDDGSFYVDVNRDGVFDENNSERWRGGNNGQFTASGLQAGVAYDIAIGLWENLGSEDFGAYFQTPSITSWTKVNPDAAAQAGMWFTNSPYGVWVSGGDVNVNAEVTTPGILVSGGTLNVDALLTNSNLPPASLHVTGGMVNANVAVGSVGGNEWALAVSGGGIYNADAAASVGTEEVAVGTNGTLNLNAAGALSAGQAATASGAVAAVNLTADGAAAGATLNASEGGGIVMPTPQTAGNFPTVNLGAFGGLAGDLAEAVYSGVDQNVFFVEDSILGDTGATPNLPDRATVEAQTGVTGPALWEPIYDNTGTYGFGDDGATTIYRGGAFGPWTQGRNGADVTFTGTLQEVEDEFDIGPKVLLNNMNVSINENTTLLSQDTDYQELGQPPYRGKGAQFLGEGQLQVTGPVVTGDGDEFDAQVYSRIGYYDPEDGSGRNTTGDSILLLDAAGGGVTIGQSVRVDKGIVHVNQGDSVATGGIVDLNALATLHLNQDGNARPSSGTYILHPGSLVAIDDANRMTNGAYFEIDPAAYVLMINNTDTDAADPNSTGFNNVNLIIAANEFTNDLKIGSERLLTTPSRQGHDTSQTVTDIVAGNIDPEKNWVRFGNANNTLDINSDVVLPGIDIKINDWPGVYYDLPKSETDLTRERVELNGQVNFDRQVFQFNNVEVLNGGLYIGHGDGGNNNANGRNIDIQSTGSLTVYSSGWLNIESQWDALAPKIESGELFPEGIIIENGARLDRIRYLLGGEDDNNVDINQTFIFRKGSSTAASYFRIDEDGTDGNNDAVAHIKKFIMQEGAYVGLQRANQDADEIRYSVWLENIPAYDGMPDDTNMVQMDRAGDDWSFDDVGLVDGSEPMTLLVNRPGNGGTHRVYGTIGVADSEVTFEMAHGNLNFEQGSDIGPNAVVIGAPNGDVVRVYAGADGTAPITGGVIELRHANGIEVYVDNGFFDLGPPLVVQPNSNVIGATINIGPGLNGVDLESFAADTTGNLPGTIEFNRVRIGDGSLAEVIRNNGTTINVRNLDLGPDGRIDLNQITLRPDSISGNGQVFDGIKVELNEGGLLEPGKGAGTIAVDMSLETEAGVSTNPGEEGFTYKWENTWVGDASDDILSDLVAVDGDLTLGDNWVLTLVNDPASVAEPLDGTVSYDLFTYTGTLTASGTGGAGVGGVLANVTIDGSAFGLTPADLVGAEVYDDGAGTVVLRGVDRIERVQWDAANPANDAWTGGIWTGDVATPTTLTEATMAQNGLTATVASGDSAVAHRLLIDDGTVAVDGGGLLTVNTNVDVADGAELSVAGELNAGVINTAGIVSLAGGNVGKINADDATTTVSGGNVGEINVNAGSLDYSGTGAGEINVTGAAMTAGAGATTGRVLADDASTVAASSGLTVTERLSVADGAFAIDVSSGSATAMGVDLVTEVEELTLNGDVFVSTGLASGLEGRYHSGVGSHDSVTTIDWSADPTDIVIDAQVNFPSTNNEFHPPLTGYVNQFGVEWVGYVSIPTPGDVTFYTNSDDGSTLEIDGVQIVANDGDHGMTTQSGVATGLSGFAPIRMLFYEDGGGAGMIASWDNPTTGTTEVIPADALFHLTGGASLGDLNQLPDMVVNVPTASSMGFAVSVPATLGDLNLDANLALSGVPSVSFANIAAAHGTTLTADLVEVRETLAPGVGIGQLTVAGDLAMLDDSVLKTELTGNAGDANIEADLVEVIGDLDISSTLDNLELSWLPITGDTNSVFGGTYRIVSYDTPLAGEIFDNVDGNVSAYIDEILYDVDDDPVDPDNPLAIDVKLFDLLLGDVNLDGRVNITDLAIMGNPANWGTVGTATWFEGDLNLDGTVNITDLAILGNPANWGSTLPAPGLDAPAPVPEPGTIVLLLMGLAGLLGASRLRKR